MTFDDATLMAYADGELGPIETKRIARAAVDDPALAQRIAAHRGVRTLLADAYGTVAAEPVPDRLAALVTAKVVPIGAPAPPRSRANIYRWSGIGIAAALALTVGLTTPWRTTGTDGVADTRLAAALDTQLAGSSGDPRMLVSFRDRSGRYCRVFDGAAQAGIACRAEGDWRLVRTARGAAAAGGDYRQAGSGDAALLAAAQDMMAGDPLDIVGEETARRSGWR